MSINAIGVIGAGTMGSGIAQVAAAAGLSVLLVDVSDEFQSGRKTRQAKHRWAGLMPRHATSSRSSRSI